MMSDIANYRHMQRRRAQVVYATMRRKRPMVGLLAAELGVLALVTLALAGIVGVRAWLSVAVRGTRDMGQSRPIRQQPDFSSHLFLVGQSKGGFWVARDLEGKSEGIFRDRKAAMRFALFEGGHANAVMLSPNAVEPSFGMGVR